MPETAGSPVPTRPVFRAGVSGTSLRLVAGSVSAVLLAAGCASGKSDEAGGGSGTTVINVVLNNDGCRASPAKVPAGPATFSIKNEGGSTVSEAELVRGTKILGEKEGLTPGLSGSFSLNLVPGDYEMYCPHANTERSPFTVTQSLTRQPSSAPASDGAAALLSKAPDQYRRYVQSKTEELVALTAPFVAAVKAGEVAVAKARYAKARAPYESIEPVAESFGDLDLAIDGRDGDVPARDWSGFHRIEKQLWIAGNTKGMVPVADKLLADVKMLAARIKTTTFQPAELANGATELLNEISKTKLTGEEERYSRTDLSDVDANLQGSQAAFDLLAPALEVSDPGLTSTIRSRFNDARVLMQKYARPGGEFARYPAVTPAQIKVLIVAFDALAEPLSKVGETVVAIS
ncbi:MAG: iron uptake system component EfeO [Pseudonocardiales bacterium]|nr:iron uptake system component EfeO [Pseudonocardiales bacterium]